MQLLVGLGSEKKGTGEGIRRACATALKVAGQRRAKKLGFVPPHGLKKEEVFRSAIEGFLLSNYTFHHWKHDTKKDLPPPVEEFVWIGPKEEKLLEEIETVMEGVSLVRDLVNGNADEVTPKKLADTAKKASAAHLKVEVHDKKWLEKNKMGLILAVSRGAAVDPFLIEMSYRGNPHSKEHVVLVGKGVTYDTGGLALKPAEGMLSMKCDMAGAATVMATVQTAARLKLKVNVTALIPTVENAIGPHSYKNGDVYRGFSGRTVEIVNTDAEGRLILADAMAYAVEHLKPTCMVDLATLTGGIVVALGEEIAGLFASDDRLAKDLLAASKEVAEPIWRFPLPSEYREMLKSDIADTLNAGGRMAGSITAALFLEDFVGDIPWAHLDIAGTAFWSKPKYYNPTKATGFGVRLLIEFLKAKQ